MNKIIKLLLIPMLFLTSCAHINSGNVIKDSTLGDTTSSNEDISMKLVIDETQINVSWLNNDSVNELKENTPLIVQMNRYGGFEQVGSIGRRIASNDEYITTDPGDIVLYNSSNIVIFFGSNSWEYTKLGHIDLTVNELEALLDKPSVTLRIE